jgi:hypothetical protein
MGRPESANHGSTKNKSKSFQASRRAGRAVRKREQQGAGRTRRSGAVPAGLHWSSQLPVCRRAALQGSGSAKGWRRRTRIWREATTRANPGEERGGQRYFEAPVRPGSRPHRVSESGGDEQMFGAKQQVPHGVSGD